MKNIMILLTFIQCAYSCSMNKNKGIDDSLCKDFCKLNKEQKFNILFETSTANSRFKNGSPTEIGVYCKDVNGFFITIPLKLEELKGRKLYESSLFYECKNKGHEDTLIFKKFISDFNEEYNRIKVPLNYLYSKPKIEGNPHLGKFIEFTLNDKCKVYYLDDAQSLTPYWKDKFKKLHQVDKKWYYEYEQ